MMDSKTFADLVEIGSDGPGQGAFTMWELWVVMTNPDLRRKTTFYLDGKVYTPPEGSK